MVERWTYCVFLVTCLLLVGKRVNVIQQSWGEGSHSFAHWSTESHNAQVFAQVLQTYTVFVRSCAHCRIPIAVQCHRILTEFLWTAKSVTHVKYKLEYQSIIFWPRTKFAADLPSTAQFSVLHIFETPNFTSVRGTAINHSCQHVVYLHITSCPVALSYQQCIRFFVQFLIRAETHRTTTSISGKIYDHHDDGYLVASSAGHSPSLNSDNFSLMPISPFVVSLMWVFFVNIGYGISNTISKYWAKNFHH